MYVCVGVNAGGSGDRAVRMRPFLVFDEKHAKIFLDILRFTLQDKYTF